MLMLEANQQRVRDFAAAGLRARVIRYISRAGVYDTSVKVTV